MKNSRYAIIAVMLCALMLSGCAGDKDTTNSIDNTTSTESTTTVSVTESAEQTESVSEAVESISEDMTEIFEPIESLVEIETAEGFAFYEETPEGNIVVSVRDSNGMSKMIYIFDEHKVLKDANVQLIPADGVSFDEIYESSGATVEKEEFAQIRDNVYGAQVNIMNDIPFEYHTYQALLEYVETSVGVYNAFASVDGTGDVIGFESNITAKFDEYTAVIKSDTSGSNEVSLRVDLSKTFDEGVDAIEIPEVYAVGIQKSDPDVKTELSMDVYSILNVDDTVTWYYNYTFTEGEVYDTISISVDEITMKINWSELFG